MPSDQLDPDASSRFARVRELMRLFFRLGVTAFGGPAVHIALMEDALVERRRWLTRERFLTLLGITNLLPGPNSTEMAMHIGHLRAGGIGLVAAGVAFITPAAIMSAALAWLYLRYDVSPPVIGVLYGLKPVVVAVVLQALWRLGRSALRTPALIAVAIVAITVTVSGAHELVVLLTGGLAHLVFIALSRGRADRPTASPPSGATSGSGVGGGAGIASVALLADAASSAAGARGFDTPGSVQAASVTGATAAATAAATTTAVVTAAPSLVQIFLVFLKIGSVLFGSGYVLLFLRADVVQRYGWITETQLVDAIAIGQIVPGPVTTTATFIGYLIGGMPGAIVATVGIFLPAFCFVAISGRFVAIVERSSLLQAFVDGVVAASLALVAIVTYDLGRAALIDLPTIGIAVASAVALMLYRVNPVWPVLVAACIGFAVTVFAR
jgi:chromate transporter